MALTLDVANTGLIALNVELGQNMWNETVLEVPDIDKYYEKITDVKPNFSGPASLALIINTLHLAYTMKMSEYRWGSTEFSSLLRDYWDGKELILNEDDIVNLKKVRDDFQQFHIEKNGMTLKELERVAMKLGFVVITHYAYDDDLEIKNEKRDELKKIAEEWDKNILNNANDLKTLLTNKLGEHNRKREGFIANFQYGETGGHHSPIGAYHENGSVLVMEVKPDLKPVWVDAEVLYKAMRTVDPQTGLPRGLIELYRPWS